MKCEKLRKKLMKEKKKIEIKHKKRVNEIRKENIQKLKLLRE